MILVVRRWKNVNLYSWKTYAFTARFGTLVYEVSVFDKAMSPLVTLSYLVFSNPLYCAKKHIPYLSNKKSVIWFLLSAKSMRS